SGSCLGNLRRLLLRVRFVSQNALPNDSQYSDG
ncbi:MAG: hypothetical protein QOG25_2358, partial [Acetobacteraceae bacterium]|nr:hypothetical protein [Acetobacteraceae bacterium]